MRRLLYATLLSIVACVREAPNVQRSFAPSSPRTFLVDENKADASLQPGTVEGAVAVLANDFAGPRGVLFSPDGASLAVADDEYVGWGCVQRVETSVTVYDTRTWRARVVQNLGANLYEWAFDAKSMALVLRVSDRAAARGHRVMTVDVMAGVMNSPAEGLPGPSMSRPTQTTKLGDRVAQANASRVVVAHARTGALETELGATPDIHVEALAFERAVDVVALWPTGELAAWDVVASAHARFDPPLSDHRVVLFDTDERGVLMLVRDDGVAWRYQRDASGVHRGRVVVEAAHATSLPIDRAGSRWFAGFADGRVRGFDASNGRLMFSADTRAGRASRLEPRGEALRVWSPAGQNWTFDLGSSRLLGVAIDGMVGLLASEVSVSEAMVDTSGFEVGCFGSTCSVNTGTLSVRVVPGWRSGSLLLHDGVEFELLGGPGRDAVRCLRGASVVDAEDCEEATRGVRIVERMRARAAFIAALSRQ